MYIVERIKEIWQEMSRDKKRLADTVLHAGAKRVLGEVVAGEYFGRTGTRTIPDLDMLLSFILIMLEAITSMGSSAVERQLSTRCPNVDTYLDDGFAAALERGTLKNTLSAYSSLKGRCRERGVLQMASFAELYSEWIEKTAIYVADVQSVYRVVTFNELYSLWDTEHAAKYLAIQYKLNMKRHCDQRRVFVYDSRYWENRELLRRLLIEVSVHYGLGIRARVYSVEQLNEKGRGFPYPLEAFAVYDRTCYAVAIFGKYSGKTYVNFIHREALIRDAIEVFDGIYDAATPAMVWVRKHKKILTADDHTVKEKRLKYIKEL